MPKRRAQARTLPGEDGAAEEQRQQRVAHGSVTSSLEQGLMVRILGSMSMDLNVFMMLASVSSSWRAAAESASLWQRWVFVGGVWEHPAVLSALASGMLSDCRLLANGSGLPVQDLLVAHAAGEPDCLPTITTYPQRPVTRTESLCDLARSLGAFIETTPGKKALDTPVCVPIRQVTKLPVFLARHAAAAREVTVVLLGEGLDRLAAHGFQMLSFPHVTTANLLFGASAGWNEYDSPAIQPAEALRAAASLAPLYQMTSLYLHTLCDPHTFTHLLDTCRNLHTLKTGIHFQDLPAQYRLSHLPANFLPLAPAFLSRARVLSLVRDEVAWVRMPHVEALLVDVSSKDLDWYAKTFRQLGSESPGLKVLVIKNDSFIEGQSDASQIGNAMAQGFSGQPNSAFMAAAFALVPGSIQHLILSFDQCTFTKPPVIGSFSSDNPQVP